MRKTLSVSILLLALCGSAFAGDMGTPSAPQPPQKTTAEESTTDQVVQAGEADGITDTLLSVLGSALESLLALR